MFLNNKYTALYYKIIASAQERNTIKTLHDGYQTHHIIPRCFGGTDDPTNLVVLTYKEHRVCHHLLINMTADDAKYKMMYAYKLFNKQYDTSGAPTPQIYCTADSYVKMVSNRKRQGSYKTGKEDRREGACLGGRPHRSVWGRWVSRTVSPRRQIAAPLC